MEAIALDAMGGDEAPACAVEGAALASLEPHGPSILLVGDQEELGRRLDKLEHDAERLSIVHASDAIPMDCEPRTCLNAHPDASLLVAARLVKAGEAAALVSAGNTGAVIKTCAEVFERLPGVQRCALGAVYPTDRRRGEKKDPFSLILDAGLTVEVTAADLVAFAVMGSAYATRISQNEAPRVALLSNGTEASKGPPCVVEAHRLLSERNDLNFIGNIEGMDIPRGTADVIVTGGFVGNIVLKMLEGVAETVMRLGKYAFKKNLVYKAGLTLLAPAVKQLKTVTDWEQYGGAPLLGFDHPCIKAHGRSSPVAIKNALKVAHKAARSDLVTAITEGLASRQSAQEPSQT